MVFVAMEEIVEKLGDTFSILEKDEAACNRLKVGLGQGFVEVYEDAQHLRMIIFFFFINGKIVHSKITRPRNLWLRTRLLATSKV